MTAAAEDQLEIFGKLLHEKFDTRCIGMIGAAEHLDQEKEVLHRSVRVINSELAELEADQEHVLLEGLGLIQSNLVKTPRMQLSASDAETIENGPILDGEQATSLKQYKCLARAMSKPRGGKHDTIETSCEVLERSAEKSIAVLRARPKRSSLRSARGQRLGWRHGNASKHFWSDRAVRSTFAQTQFNSSKRDWTQ